MQEGRLDWIERLEQFSEGTAGVTPRVAGGETQQQAHARWVLARFNYAGLARRDKDVVVRYLQPPCVRLDVASDLERSDEKTTYSQDFKEEVVRKALSRGNRTIAQMAEQLNVPYHSLRKWLGNFKMAHIKIHAGEKRPNDWTAEQRLHALHDADTLSGEVLQAWCRQNGVFVHQLTSWRAAFCAKVTPSSENTRATRALKDKIAHFECDLNRKDKALSETAALLVLQKITKSCERTRTNGHSFPAPASYNPK